jgi:DNA polymerase V
MGIPMGEPYYRIEPLLKSKGVVVFSGNHHLYAEVSRRVVDVLARFTDAIDVYSIDEAFLNFSIRSIDDPLRYASKIRYTVGRWVGVPISIGIAASKTLAKIASKLAKKTEDGVFQISENNREEILKNTPVIDVWNLGRQSAAKLERYGVRTAADLTRKNPAWVKKILTTRGLLTMMELQGYQLSPLVSPQKPPQSIQASHAFAEPLHSLEELTKPLIDRAVRVGEKLRNERLSARVLSVNLRYGYLSGEHGYLGEGVVLDFPVCSDRDLSRVALWLLRKIYREDKFYTQAGVYLSDLVDATHRQRTIFDDPGPERLNHERMSRAVDEINATLGKRAIFPAAIVGDDRKWRPKNEFRSSGALDFS